LRLVLLDELGFDDPKLAIREAVAQVPWMGERLVVLHGHGRVWGPADLRAIRAEAAVLRPMKTETLQRLLDGPAGVRRTETSALSSLGVALRAVANGVGDASIEDAAAANANPSLRVLLAEDNPVNQRVAASILKKLGCVVTVAENGAEAVDAAAAQTFDLILLDYHMPVMDGLEAARILSARRGPARKIPPIFALTASVFDEHRRQCLEAGMDGILSKPIHVRALRDCVDSAIELRDRVSLEADPV
ncbi:MAG: response regulator, partial [Bryobacterales bacterium]|nr:response regulator [Bryobacterales bacterium]